MKIRRARLADLEAAATLWRERMALLRQSDSGIELAPDAIECWRDQARHWLVDAAYGFYVAESEARIVGLAVVTAKEGKPGLYPERGGVLVELAVDLHQPHRGLSGRLIERVKSWLLARNITVLDIQTPARYPVEDAFWRAQGATLSARQYRLWI